MHSKLGLVSLDCLIFICYCTYATISSPPFGLSVRYSILFRQTYLKNRVYSLLYCPTVGVSYAVDASTLLDCVCGGLLTFRADL